MKGILALDVDGTITDSKNSVPEQMVFAIENFAMKGWQILFLTGRSLQSVAGILKNFKSNYVLGVHNGAIVLEMPEKKVIERTYLNKIETIPIIKQLTKKIGVGLAVYTGCENRDITYYCPPDFSKELWEYLEKRKASFREHWVPVCPLDSIEVKSFPSFKFFGKKMEAQHFVHEVERLMSVHVPVISDPHDDSYVVAQATHVEANKGETMKRYVEQHAKGVPVIAAGDDLNDLPMLEQADFKITLSNAPEELLAIADIVVDKSVEGGLVKAIFQGVKKLEEGT